mmetsp:Transcript_28345/g.43660  ORF Transcript_28345/g.43660 Transcript_28345/m.43660 type:complete len:106 (+) Transcript_28345:282-599(+)
MNLQSTTHDKTSWKKWFASFCKRIKAHYEESIADENKKKETVDKFLAGAKEMGKWVNDNYDALEPEFYCPPSYDIENSIIFAYYKEEALTPTFLFFKAGLKEVAL